MCANRSQSSAAEHNGGDPGLPELSWIPAEDNPWEVPLLDVRPVTLSVVSTSRDPQCAANALSYGKDDGTAFIGQEPAIAARIATSLRYPLDRMLAEGVLFAPRLMEHKWALFYHQQQIICVRSWLRQVQAIADVVEHGDYVEVTSIRGKLVAEEESAFTVRALDYLLRSHALGVVYPAPLPAELATDPRAAALWCVAQFGKRAWFATPLEVPYREPQRALRSNSLLHLAAAEGDAAAVAARLDEGLPPDLLAADGLAPLHWALASADPQVLELLLRRGSPVDVRSTQGVTPLMTAVQLGNAELVQFLLDRGADPSAVDAGGFTPLFRAAESGRADIVRLLLECGAQPDVETRGKTPRSLAERAGHDDVVALLQNWSR